MFDEDGKYVALPAAATDGRAAAPLRAGARRAGRPLAGTAEWDSGERGGESSITNAILRAARGRSPHRAPLPRQTRLWRGTGSCGDELYLSV
eukprot:CAMPEP_0175398576 /NCGR_PEP_ID=MMETSP0095-20121207/35563_1 /TAXON_ID=311494 /ORGANISM="Alexandrium monilatum, Strain CCMP3105" /LENGTH=91 /DNA_ID=CAMNT_0016697297 /DNA_START=110 /DNA_END=386 /DNA_ORIENTATION=-